MQKNDKIYIAGHNGQVGKSIVSALQKQGFRNLITISKNELDLRNQTNVDYFFKFTKPDFVFTSAATVGGINANLQFPATFSYDNLMISLNIINSAYKYHVKKLLYLGSTCIYPSSSTENIHENDLLNGKPEFTNEGYALAKIIGLKLCEYYNRQYNTCFITSIPCNTYGPYDHFFTEGAHVIPDLFVKFHNAISHNEKEIFLQGTGNSVREYIYSDDLAHACIHLMNNYNSIEPINIGTNEIISIKNLAYKIAELFNYNGNISFSNQGANGATCRILNLDKMNTLGWKPQISLSKGLSLTYDFFKTKYLF